MDVLDICQEAVSAGFISSELAEKLDQTLWCYRLSAVESATLDFVSRRIESGQIKVDSQLICQLNRGDDTLDLN